MMTHAGAVCVYAVLADEEALAQRDEAAAASLQWADETTGQLGDRTLTSTRRQQHEQQQQQHAKKPAKASVPALAKLVEQLVWSRRSKYATGAIAPDTSPQQHDHDFGGWVGGWVGERPVNQAGRKRRHRALLWPSPSDQPIHALTHSY